MSAVIIYSNTISKITLRFSNGKGISPIEFANGKYGSAIVKISPRILRINKYLPGLLLKKFLCVRMMNKINSSVSTDSTNQPV